MSSVCIVQLLFTVKRVTMLSVVHKCFHVRIYVTTKNKMSSCEVLDIFFLSDFNQIWAFLDILP